MFQQTKFQRLIAMNRNDNALPMTCLGKNMMTPVDTFEQPAALLKETNKFLAGNLLHTVSSRTLSLALDSVTSSSTESQSSIASCKLAFN